MGGQEPGEAQGGKPRRKKGGSSSRRPRRGDRGGSHGAGGWRKRAEGEEKRRDDEVTEVASKSVNELGSGKAEMEQKEGELRRRKAAEEEAAAVAAAVAAAKAAEEAEQMLARLKEKEDLAKKRAEEERYANAKALLEDEHRRKNEWKALREANSPDAVAKRREALDAVKGQLKSDLKKTSAFMSKVRMLNESQRASITKDSETLNLTRYVSEIADAVSEAKLKISDIPVAIHLCHMMHQRYEDFTQTLISNLLAPLREESLRATKGEEEDKEAFRKRRVNLRLLTELHLCGVFEGTTVLLRVLKRLAGMSRREQSSPKHEMDESDRRVPIEACPHGMRSNDVNLLVAFARHVAWPMAGLCSRRVQEAAELVEESYEDGGGWGCCNGEHESFAAVLIETYSQLSSHLEIVHRELQRLEFQAEKDRAMYGTLNEDKEATLDSSRKAYDKLLSNVTLLSEAIDKPIPELPDETAEEEVAGIELWTGEGPGSEGREGLLNQGPWEDDETRSFYEDLPDLFMSVLPSQLGFTTEEWANLRGEHEHGRLKEDEVAEGALDELPSLGKEEGGGGDGLSMVTEDLQAELGLGKLEPLDEVRGEETEVGNGQNEYSPDMKTAAEYDEEEDNFEAEDNDENSIDASSSSQQFHLLLAEELPQCHNRERSDAICIKFCEMNSKSARKRLITTLYNVPRQALHLLPQYARIVATLNQVFKDIATGLVAELRAENRRLLRKRTASHLIETKRKNVLFLSELIKFRMAPPVVAFSMLNSCFQDFSGNNIEMACCLLEGCGRFLYCSKHTKDRIAKYIDTLQRLKKARNLEPKYEIMIDNAYYYCRPPVGASARHVKILTPLQLWIRYNLFERLETVGPETIVRVFRKLPWSSIPTAAAAEIIVQTEKTSSLEEKAPSAPQFGAADVTEGFVEAPTEGGDTCLPISSVGTEKKETGVIANQEQDHEVVKEVDVEMELKKCFLKVAQKKYTLARLAAQVLQGLHKYYPSLTVRVVDDLLEDLIFACEAIGPPSDLQRRLGCARLFSELYNCSLVSGTVVFATLHRILDIGHAIPPSLFSISLPPPPPPLEDGGGGNATPLSDEPPVFPLAPWATYDPRAVHPCDPPGDCFRIRIAVQILDACAERLPRVNNRDRLVKFLTYFQRYLFCKQGVPADTEFAVLDLLDKLEFQSRVASRREESKPLLNTSDLAKRGRRKHMIRGAAAAVANGKEAESDAALLPIYSTWAEAHLAVEDIEKKQHELKEAKKRRFATMGKDKSENAAVDDEIESRESGDSGEEDEEEEDDYADEVGMTGVTSPLSGDEEEDNKSYDEQQNLLQDKEQYDDDNVHVYQDDSIFQKAEADEEFDHLYSKLMTETLNKSNVGAVRSTKASYNMPMPSVVGRIAVADSKSDQPITGGDGVSFRMIKRGAKGKLEGQALVVPSETNLAVHQIHVNLRESGEYELIKQRVLAYGNSQSAMEASGSIPELNNPRLVKEEARDRGGSGHLDHAPYVCVPAVTLKGSKGGSSSSYQRPPKT